MFLAALRHHRSVRGWGVGVCAFLLVACGGAASPRTADPGAESSGASQEGPSELLDPAPEMQVAGMRGTLSQDEVRMALEPRLMRFSRCFMKGARRLEWIGGEIALQFRVRLDGSVAHVHPLSSTVGDRRTEVCVLSAASKTRFPSPRGGEAEFSWSFEVPADPDLRPPTPWIAGQAAQAVREQWPALRRACGAAGEGLVATVRVDTDGSVMAAGVGWGADDTERDTTVLLDCIAEGLAQWQFESPGSWPARVQFDLR